MATIKSVFTQDQKQSVVSNNKYFGKTLSRDWLIFQIPKIVLDFAIPKCEDTTNRYMFLSEVFAKAFNCDTKTIFNLFVGHIGHVTSEVREVSNFVLEQKQEVATTDKTNSENELLVQEVHTKIKAFEKSSGRLVTPQEVESAINEMVVSDEQKAYLFKTILSREIELSFN